MLRDVSAEAMMADARAMHQEAIARLEAGDWRDASEKAWCAARNASQALLMETSAEENPRTTNINAGIRAMARERGGRWVEMPRHLSEIAYQLHIEAFYGGVYDDDIPRLVRSVADYIALAEELASAG